MNSPQTRSSRAVLIVLVCAALLSMLASLPAQAAQADCTCPANTTTDFYANPAVDRSSCIKNKSYAPTGVLTPAICSYRTLTAAMAAATAGLNYADSTRVIASGGASGAPAVFGAETYPMLIPCGISLTTADNPALGGSGFQPANYVILFNSSTADHALTLRGGPISGFTIQNAGASTGSALTCHNQNVSVESVRLDGLNGSFRLTNGLVVSGSCSGTFTKMEVRNFAGTGVLLNTSSADTSEFTYVDLHHNQIGLKALSGSLVIQEGGQIQMQSRIHDNTGDGIALGDPADQAGVVTALIQNAVIDNNDIGLLVQQADVGAKSTHWTLFGSEIVQNRGNGLYASVSFPVRDPNGAMISGNVIGTNGWTSADACINALASPPPGPAAETASQIVFDGVFPATAQATQACASHATVTDCNADFTNSCVWNPGAPANMCGPAWDLSGVACSDTNTNVITGYHRAGPENEDFRVGVVAANGAWVKTMNDVFLTSAFDVHQDWTAIGSSSFASNGGTVCAQAPIRCPVAPPVVPPIAP